MLVPRTFSFDKYQFKPEGKVDRTASVESPRPVAKGEQTEIKKNQERQTRGENPQTPDQFKESHLLPRDFSQPHFKIRNLWSPREEPTLFQNPLNIIVGFDGSGASLVAMGAALDLAQKYHCSLTILQVIAPEGSSPFANQETERQLARKINHALQQTVPEEYLKKYPPKVQVVAHADPAEALVQAAHQESCSLMVIGFSESGKSGVSRLGNVPYQILKKAPCPVLVWPKQRTSLNLNRVLVPTDGTRFSYPAITQAIILCEDLKSDLFLFHALSPSPQKGQDNANLSRIMTTMDWRNVKHDLVTATGDVLQTLSQFCESKQVDMVVMGTHSPEAGDAAFQNSITIKVVEKLICPVLVVHPHS